METRLDEIEAHEGYSYGEFKPVFPCMGSLVQEADAGKEASLSIPQYPLYVEKKKKKFPLRTYTSATTSASGSGCYAKQRPNYFVGVRLVPPDPDPDPEADGGRHTSARFLRNVKEVVTEACKFQPGLLAGVVPSSTFHITLLTMQLTSQTDVYHVARSMIDMEQTSAFQHLYSVLCRAGVSFQKVALLSERLLVAIPGAEAPLLTNYGNIDRKQDKAKKKGDKTRQDKTN
jgi:hypothetical protein